MSINFKGAVTLINSKGVTYDHHNMLMANEIKKRGLDAKVISKQLPHSYPASTTVLYGEDVVLFNAITSVVEENQNKFFSTFQDELRIKNNIYDSFENKAQKVLIDA